MPRAAPRPCSYKGCRTLVHDGSGRCAAHPRETWSKVTPTKRITGRRLQAMREALFKRDPLCAKCRCNGKAVPATQRDHIKPLSEGGADDETNEQGLCGPCHDEKSAIESKRGRWGRK